MNKKVKILVIDDDVQVLDVVQLTLDCVGYDVDKTTSGTKALELAKNKQYDLIVSDIKMPEISGVDIIKKLKENNYNTHFILMTGFSGEYSEQSVLALGIDAYLEKPFNIQLLIEIVESVLRV